MVTSNFPDDATVNLDHLAVGGGQLVERLDLAEPAAASVLPPEQRIDAAFRTEETVRATVTENLKRRSAESVSIAERAKAAFARFDPSRHPVAERMKADYLSPGDDLMNALKTTMFDRLEMLRQEPGAGRIRLAMSDKLERLLEQDPHGPQLSKVDLSKFVKAFDLKNVSGLKQKPPPSAWTICTAETEAKNRLAAIQNPSGAAPAGSTSDGNGAVGSAHVVPGSANGDGTGRAAALVESEVGRQMATATSPESPLRFAVPQRSGQDDRQQALDTFELRDGPSDVTSYHDFSTLHIAFPHVWTELFDGKLREIGTEIYQYWLRLQEFAGLTPKDKPITSLDDIRALLREVRQLSQFVALAVPKATDIGSSSKGAVITTFEGTGVNTSGIAWTEKASGGAQQQGDGSRLEQLLVRMEALLTERYEFHVFAENTINFGFIVTYRQKWEPVSYQVGDLVNTIPLAPKETRRYTTRRVSKRTRAVKELHDNLHTRRSEWSETSRVEREIVEKAQQKSNFTLTAHESFGGDGFQFDSTQTLGGEQAKESARTKKEFRENVMKAAQEYKQQHRMEVETTESHESEETTFHEIQNPNDELTVTYMFYELQRRYRISERIHKLTPVVLVANEVPAPHQVDDAWLMKHDWILRRVILDDSFRPALRYLTESFIGAEINIRLLGENASAQQKVVDVLRQQVQAQNRVLDAAEKNVQDAVTGVAASQAGQGLVNVVSKFFDPLGITKEDSGVVSAAEGMASHAKETRDRAERERARLAAQLEVAISALQAAIDKLSAAIREHYDKVAEIDRLRIHVKDNILYYLQAIWSHEPPDQRFFRMYHLDAPDLRVDTAGAVVGLDKWDPAYAALRGKQGFHAGLPLPPANIPTKKLVQIADLDTLLGYKGNYSIFGLKENNYVTLHMMQDYLEIGDELVLRDPDEAGNYTIDDLQALAACLHKRNRAEFESNKDKLEKMLIERLTSPHQDAEEIVVPTASLYIEALVGTHPLLEDFKLLHRALDVKKVQAEVRHAELENIRLAARALRGRDEDPDIERKIVVEGPSGHWALQPDGN